MTNQIVSIARQSAIGFPSVELSVAMGSAIIALAALVVAIWQIRHQQKHDRMSVRPKLDFQYGLKGSRPYKVTLMNIGLGPAKMTKFSVVVAGKELNSPTTLELGTELVKIGLPVAHMNSNTFGIPAHLRIDQCDVLLEIKLAPDASLPSEVGAKFALVKWRIDYESFYGEKDHLEIEFIA